MTRVTKVLRPALLVALVGLTACARALVPGPEPEPAGPVDPAQVESVLFLVGDAGEATSATHPILPRLKQDVEWWSERLTQDSSVVVLYLGDIVYPLGLHEPGSPEYPSDSTIVLDQVLVLAGPQARARGTQGYFLAGNHDWGLESDWEGAVRLATLSNFLVRAREHTGASVALEPAAGTGGPTVLDIGEHTRLLLLDTAWWLLYGEAEDGLEHFGVLKGIEEAMLTAGERSVVIAAHHPFRSAGPHGVILPGFYTLGLDFLLRKAGALVQDLNSPVYEELLQGMKRVFASATRPPLVCRAVHRRANNPCDATRSDRSIVRGSREAARLISHSVSGGSTRAGASEGRYLGATPAICLALLGYDVMGVDVDAGKVEVVFRVPHLLGEAPVRIGAVLQQVGGKRVP